MARTNVACHSLRLNLNNEQHRRVEKVLVSLNMDVHKSINQFLVDAADAYISRLEGSEPTYEEKKETEKRTYINREDLEILRREIKDELQREMLGILCSALTGGKLLPIPEIRQIKEPVTEEEEEADETTIGLASSWG